VLRKNCQSSDTGNQPSVPNYFGLQRWFWRNRFGPLVAAEIRKRRVDQRSCSLWRWHVDGVLVRINGAHHYLWRTVDHEGKVIEIFTCKRKNRKAALKFLRRAMKRYGSPNDLMTGTPPKGTDVAHFPLNIQINLWRMP
jgi:hypothetical protein